MAVLNIEWQEEDTWQGEDIGKEKAPLLNRECSPDAIRMFCPYNGTADTLCSILIQGGRG